MKSCTPTVAYTFKLLLARLEAHIINPHPPPLIGCNSANLRNGTMFVGITSVSFVDLLVGMHAGATMIPELGFWHSSPDSMHMAECPNHQACMGDRLSLHACQTAAYAAPALNGSTQVCLPSASPLPKALSCRMHCCSLFFVQPGECPSPSVMLGCWGFRLEA